MSAHAQPRHLLPRVLLTAAVAAVVWVGGRQALGDFALQQPMRELDDARAGQLAVTPRRLDAWHDELEQVRRLDPGNPSAPEYLAMLASVRASAAPPPARAAELERALRDDRAALGLRPNSGYLWASEMTVLHQLGRTRPLSAAEQVELHQAMARAAAFGPWEPTILREVLAVGADIYPSLNAAERTRLRECASRLMQLSVAR